MRRLILVFVYAFMLTNHLKYQEFQNVSNYCRLLKKKSYETLYLFNLIIKKEVKKLNVNKGLICDWFS